MKQRKIRLLWLGHQQDDIAETMLMRLARGSGSAGLAAPRPRQAMSDGRFHLRPLLTLKKAKIVAALRAAGASWREDATNARGDFFRNRILDVRYCRVGCGRPVGMRWRARHWRANGWRRTILPWKPGWTA